MVTRHMAKMSQEEYLPRCRVPVITSPEEEHRIVSTSAKVRGGGKGWGEEGRVQEAQLTTSVNAGEFSWVPKQ